MKDYADLHTHTIASGHAYGTITEMVHAAALKDLPLRKGTHQELFIASPI